MILTNVAIKSKVKDSLEVKVNQQKSARSQVQPVVGRKVSQPATFRQVEHRTVLTTDSVKDLASSLSVLDDSVDEKVSETTEVTFPESTIAMKFQPKHNATGSCDNAFDSVEPVQFSSTSGLQKFIENLSPEMIFLLNECAKLCINLRAFDEKLNEMQRVFVSGSLKDSQQSRQWTRVIERSRKWLRNVRVRNQFLSRLEKTAPRSGSTSGADSGDDSSSTGGIEGSSLSTEDELLHLLDRIAQFSSDLLTKTEPEVVTKTDVSFGSLCALKSGNFDCDPEWLRSLPVGLQSILKPVFLTGSNSDDSNANDTGIHCDFVQMSDMNPLVLEKLVENVQANSRLAQLQREFDRLLCTHLKSSLSQSDPSQPQCDSVPGSTSSSSFSTSLPVTKPIHPGMHGGRKPHPLSVQLRTSQPQPIPFQKHSTHLPVHISTTEPVSDISNHQHVAHPLLQPEMTVKSGQNGAGGVHCCNCSGSANLISDNDSGGEFTATTVTNEFQQSSSASATEDELSSLLNQIALCSQKIVQDTSASGSAPSSSTSTSVGCCCSSSSIEPQNKWLQPNHHVHLNHSGHLSLGPQGLQHHPLHRHGSSKSLNRSHNMDCCVAQQDGQFHWAQNDIPDPNYCGQNVYAACQPINHRLRSQSHFSPNRAQPTEYSRRFGEMHKSHSSSSLKARRSFSNHPPNHHHFQQQHWQHPYEEEYNHPQTFYDNEIYSKSKHQRKLSGAKFRERSQFSLSDAVMDCFSNNMTGFMLSNSVIDVLSPAEESPQSSSPLTLPVTERNRKPMVHPKLASAGETISGSNALDSFMLDPNMDVESFLNEMEKELEDNCYTSAPNFESRYGFEPTLPVHQLSHSRMHMMSNNSSPKHSPHYSPVRGVLPSKHSHNPHVFQYLHSSPKELAVSVSNMVPGMEHHHSPNNSNWRLSQRNSVMDLQADKSTQQNLHNHGNAPGHFPFPSMTSMPNGLIGNVNGTAAGSLGPSSPGHQSSFRRLVPSSNGRDLLDKFRAQVATRANHEADQQLKQIDHWLNNHLNDGSNVDANIQVDNVGDDDDDDDADEEGKTLAVSQNLIHFS